MPNANVKAIGRIKFAVKLCQSRLGDIQMPHVVLGRVLGFAFIQKFPHGVFHLKRIHAFFDNIVLMKHMSKKVSVVQLVHNIVLKRLRQLLNPIGIIAPQGDI